MKRGLQVMTAGLALVASGCASAPRSGNFAPGAGTNAPRATISAPHAANAGPGVALRCDGVTVETVTVQRIVARTPFARPAPRLEISRDPDPAPTARLEVIAWGPVLGSMDSSHIATRLACRGSRITLTATLTRSAFFNGAALQNVIWRPRLVLRFSALGAPLTLRTTWVLRNTAGRTLRRATTPTYPEQSYPATVELKLTPPRR